MYCGIPTWKLVLPVDIIDISAMVTRQGACTPPHWVTTWSRDACSQGQSSCWHSLYGSLIPRSCHVAFCRLQYNFSVAHMGRAWEWGYMYSTSAKLENSHLYVTSITSFVDSLSHPPWIFGYLYWSSTMQVNQDTRLSNWKEVAAPMQSTGVSSKVSWD